MEINGCAYCMCVYHAATRWRMMMMALEVSCLRKMLLEKQMQMRRASSVFDVFASMDSLSQL